MTAITIKEKPFRPLRHELKFPIPQREDRILSSRLGSLLDRDSHAGPDGSYRITSLYFDNLYDKALKEKVHGVDRREKFRIRYYGASPDLLRLEKKSKVNGLCRKENARMTRAQVEGLLQGKISFLLENGHPLFIELYTKLRGQLLAPRTIVCYDREAFVYGPGNVRVTLDRNLRTSIRCADFLDPDRQHISANDDLAILEVKYDAFLPEIVRMAVQTPSLRQSASSKYALCRRYE